MLAEVGSNGGLGVLDGHLITLKKCVECAFARMGRIGIATVDDVVMGVIPLNILSLILKVNDEGLKGTHATVKFGIEE